MKLGILLGTIVFQQFHYSCRDLSYGILAADARSVEGEIRLLPHPRAFRRFQIAITHSFLQSFSLVFFYRTPPPLSWLPRRLPPPPPPPPHPPPQTHPPPLRKTSESAPQMLCGLIMSDVEFSRPFLPVFLLCGFSGWLEMITFAIQLPCPGFIFFPALHRGPTFRSYWLVSSFCFFVFECPRPTPPCFEIYVWLFERLRAFRSLNRDCRPVWLSIIMS